MLDFKNDNIFVTLIIFPFSLTKDLHAAAAKSLQSCPTLCDPIHGSPPGCLNLGKKNQGKYIKEKVK